MGIEEVLQDGHSQGVVPPQDGKTTSNEEPALSPELSALLDVAELQRCLSNDPPGFEKEEDYHAYLHLKFSLRSLKEV